MVREALAAAVSEAFATDLVDAACASATTSLPEGMVRVAADGRPVAGCNMAAQSPFAGFDTIQDTYLEYMALLDAPARLEFTRERANYKPGLGVPSFDQGPGDIAVLTSIYEIIHKLNHMLLVGLFYGTQEELGTSDNILILNVFTGDAVGIARTAIDNVSTSDSTSCLLHSALRALLQAYLQPRPRGQGVACAVRGFCLAVRFCVQLDRGCSLVRVGQCNCHSYCS